MPNSDFVYLGDAVFAGYDGYYIELRTNSLNDPTDTIFLEPAVWQALIDFVEKHNQELRNPSEEDA